MIVYKHSIVFALSVVQYVSVCTQCLHSVLCVFCCVYLGYTCTKSNLDLLYIYIYICTGVGSSCVASRVGLDLIGSMSTWFGILVSMLLRSSGPKTHAGPSFLLRKGVGFHRFDRASVSI